MKHLSLVWMATMSLALAAAVIVAADEVPAPRADLNAATSQPAEKTAATDLTVAILDFDCSSANPELGKQIGEVLTATLGGEPGFRLVDRSTLMRTLQEHELNLTGLVAPDQATKIGKLVGARILVTGKVFELDSKLFLTGKIIGTETSLVVGVLISGEKNASVGDLLMKLSTEVSAKLRQSGPRLVAQEDAGKDPLPELKKFFAGRKLPKVSIHIQERHVAAAQAAGIDPAVETEIRSLFGECGFAVIDGDATQQVEAGVTLLVSGEGFSEFAARIGNLVSCEARIDAKLSDRKTSQVLFSDRVTTRAVDLAENVASKTALQKGGRILGIHMLQHLARSMADSRDKPNSKKND